MRYALPLVCVLGILLVGLTACGSEDDTPSPSDAPKTNTDARSAASNYETDPTPAPDMPLETLDGEEINLAEQDGNVVLVNFWATWCAPCRKEIPDLIDLQASLESEGLRVVGIALDEEGRSVVEPYVEKMNINYPIVIDTTRSVESKFDAMYGLPTTYVVNPDGDIVKRVLGIFPTDEMKPELREMLRSS
jgi:thiol-disulfide isomerase/thioredoxin